MEAWLTNEIRHYVGLEPLKEHWELTELRKGFWVCFDGEVIRKRISVSNASYTEADVEIVTRERQFVLPKTARGKEKKLNYTSVSGFKAEGVTFSTGISERDSISYISAVNNRNSVSLPFFNYKQLKDKDEIVAWLKRLPEIVPADYERKLERLKYMKNQQYKATPGDIFRVELDLHTDGYVLVIGDLRRMQKDKLFGKESIWNSVMTMPLFVRPYLYRTTSRNPSLEEIIAAPLSEQTWIVMDDRFLRGAYEYVAHKTLTEDDVLFPMGYGQQARFTGEEQHYKLTWGLGTVSKLAAETDFKSGLQFLNHGVYAGLHSDSFGAPEKRSWSHALDNAVYQVERGRALAEYGFPAEISYDEFNSRTGGLTRVQYLDYVARTYGQR